MQRRPRLDRWCAKDQFVLLCLRCLCDVLYMLCAVKDECMGPKWSKAFDKESARRSGSSYNLCVNEIIVL